MRKHTKGYTRKQVVTWSATRIVGAIVLLASVLIGVLGYINQHGYGIKPNPFIADFYANVATELASISITVLIIDTLNERRETQRLKEQLIREMGSFDNGIALRAVRELVYHGWHKDGSLRNANLSGANLQGVDLSRADIQGAYLVKTNLNNSKLIDTNFEGAFLNESNLQNTHLNEANLSNTDLYGVDFSGADLSNANLDNANLCYTNFTKAVVSFSQLEMGRSMDGMIMPDGQKQDVWLLERFKNLRS
jgi:hypothetical protein